MGEVFLDFIKCLVMLFNILVILDLFKFEIFFKWSRLVIVFGVNGCLFRV